MPISQMLELPLTFYFGPVSEKVKLLALTPADFLPGPRLDIKKSFAVVNGEHIIKKPKNDPSIRCIAIPVSFMTKSKTICMVFMVLSKQTDYLHLQSHSY